MNKSITTGPQEARFHQAMLDIYQTAKRDFNYHATYFLRMVSEYGGLEAAKRLLATSKPSEGFTSLWESGRLDLSVEAHVIRPEFRPLFTDAEIATATQRLEDLGYKFDQ